MYKNEKKKMKFLDEAELCVLIPFNVPIIYIVVRELLKKYNLKEIKS